MKVIKRDGREVEFDKSKISTAIYKAFKGINANFNPYKLNCMVDAIMIRCDSLNRAINVEEIQDIVENVLMGYGEYKVAKAYIKYRYDREKLRQGNSTDTTIMSLVELNNEEIKQENSNKNATIVSTQRDYVAGEVSKDITKRLLLPQDIVEAHENGLIHFHDSDYFIQHMHNCDLVNLEDMLQNGTVISDVLIEKPHSFATACNIATQIISQVASSQYGGQSISLAHLSPFVQVSRDRFYKDNIQLLSHMGENTYKMYIEQLVKKEITKGVQTLQYQIITLMTTNGQAPFITVFMNINEVEDGQPKEDLAMVIKEVLEQRLQGVKNEKGVYITPAFPKLIYVLDDNNITKDTPYYYLTELSAKCSAKRLVPDYISAKLMRELKQDVYTCMGCRSFLTTDRTKTNMARANNWVKGHKYYGRFNQGVVTINLVDVALSSERNMDRFWDILDDRLDLCYRALMIRHNRLKGTISDVAPILWQHGALARFNKGEVIDPLLYDGYSTISLGYAGLYECVKYMTGASHTGDGKEFGLQVMERLNEACNNWKQITNIDFSPYGTPLESTTYKFAKCLQKRFGVIEGITDRNYITNSYHVPVFEEIDAFSKLKLESDFQKLSSGGAISYVEIPNMNNNIDAVLSLIEFIFDNIMYAELNTKSDYCHKCGYDGEIKIVEQDGKLMWECPQCGNQDESQMSVARRTCGYIGTNFWNQGRTQEIKDRVLHL